MFRLAIPKSKWLTNKLREEKSSPAHHDDCNNKKSIFDRAAYFRFTVWKRSSMDGRVWATTELRATAKLRNHLF